MVSYLAGWTGEKVCFVGDSAGGNLVVGAALKIACKNIKIPDGILAAYGAFLVQYTPSPSRLLCLMDPLLPMGILTRCLAGNYSTKIELSSSLNHFLDSICWYTRTYQRRSGAGCG